MQWAQIVTVVTEGDVGHVDVVVPKDVPVNAENTDVEDQGDHEVDLEVEGHPDAEVEMGVGALLDLKAYVAVPEVGGRLALKVYVVDREVAALPALKVYVGVPEVGGLPALKAYAVVPGVAALLAPKVCVVDQEVEALGAREGILEGEERLDAPDQEVLVDVEAKQGTLIHAKYVASSEVF